MEETAIPLHSWFWLVVPMSAVFLLSIVNYFRHRIRTKSADHTDHRSKPVRTDSDIKEVSDTQASSGKKPSSG